MPRYAIVFLGSECVFQGVLHFAIGAATLINERCDMKKIVLRFSDAAKQEHMGRPSKLLIYARQSYTFSASEKLWIRYEHWRLSVDKSQCFCPDLTFHNTEEKVQEDAKKPRIGDDYQANLPALLSMEERMHERQRLEQVGFFNLKPETITERLPSFFFLFEFQRLVDSGQWKQSPPQNNRLVRRGNTIE